MTEDLIHDLTHDLAHLPAREQLAQFERILLSNSCVEEILQRAAALDLPNWYLTAGCVFQTVWNVLAGRDPRAGIRDYDLFYFDTSDLSWKAEDEAIQRCAKVFPDLEVEVRNEARVHLWYEERFGTRCEPFISTEDAIDSFAATTCCYGVRLFGQRLEVYAPHGFSDLFGFVLRPNPALAPKSVYEDKAARWRGEWPQLKVLPWPDGGG